MKRYAAAMLAALIALSAYSSTPLTLKLWPDGAPVDNGFTADDEFYRDGRVTSVAEAELFVYPAAEPNGTAVVMCPGGGYFRLAIESEGHHMADWFNERGITYAVLKYRMPNTHSTVPLTDAEEAVRTMRRHAAEWGIDTTRVGIMGASAGGHLASTLATHYSDSSSRPDFQVLFYPVITMEEGVTHAGSRRLLIGEQPTDSLIAAYSNELQVSESTPQAFIMVSANDDTVPVENSVRYFSALSAKGVPASLHIYPTGKHGWGFGNFTYKPMWTAELEKWLTEAINR